MKNFITQILYIWVCRISVGIEEEKVSFDFCITMVLKNYFLCNFHKFVAILKIQFIVIFYFILIVYFHTQQHLNIRPYNIPFIAFCILPFVQALEGTTKLSPHPFYHSLYPTIYNCLYSMNINL